MSKKKDNTQYIMDALELLESGMSEQEIESRFQREGKEGEGKNKNVSQYLRLAQALMRERVKDMPPESLLARVLTEIPAVSEAKQAAARAAATGIRMPEKSPEKNFTGSLNTSTLSRLPVGRLVTVLSPYWRYLVPVVGVTVLLLIIRFQGSETPLPGVVSDVSLETSSFNMEAGPESAGPPAAKALQFARTAVETVSPNQVVEALISQVTNEAQAYDAEDTDVADSQFDAEQYVPAVAKPYENI